MKGYFIMNYWFFDKGHEIAFQRKTKSTFVFWKSLINSLFCLFFKISLLWRKFSRFLGYVHISKIWYIFYFQGWFDWSLVAMGAPWLDATASHWSWKNFQKPVGVHWAQPPCLIFLKISFEGVATRQNYFWLAN